MVTNIHTSRTAIAKCETVTGEFQEANGLGSLASATANHKEMPVSNKWKAELLEARLRDLLVGETNAGSSSYKILSYTLPQFKALNPNQIKLEYCLNGSNILSASTVSLNYLPISFFLHFILLFWFRVWFALGLWVLEMALYVVQANLRQTSGPPALDFWELRLQVGVTMPGFSLLFLEAA